MQVIIYIILIHILFIWQGGLDSDSTLPPTVPHAKTPIAKARTQNVLTPLSVKLDNNLSGLVKKTRATKRSAGSIASSSSVLSISPMVDGKRKALEQVSETLDIFSGVVIYISQRLWV